MKDMGKSERIELERLRNFKSYFDEMYGKGYEIANWHLNGALEPFDSFYDSAMEEYDKVDDKLYYTSEYCFYKLAENGTGSFYKDDQKLLTYDLSSGTVTYCGKEGTNETVTLPDEINGFDELQKFLADKYSVGDNPLWSIYSDDLSGHLEMGGKEVAQIDVQTGEAKIENKGWEMIGISLDKIKAYVYRSIDAVKVAPECKDYEHKDFDFANTIFDFANTIDETAEVVCDYGKVNAMLWLHDEQLEELVNRTYLLEVANVTFDYLLSETEAIISAYADFYPEGEVELTLYLQSESYGYKDYKVILSDKEKEALSKELERVAQCRYNTTAKELLDECKAEENTTKEYEKE